MSELGSGVLAIDPDQVLRAAGALDALVDEFHLPTVVMSDVDAGHDGLETALAEFFLAWEGGLSHQLAQQKERASRLRDAVDALVGHDARIAYQFRSAIGTL